MSPNETHSKVKSIGYSYYKNIKSKLLDISNNTK